MIGPEEIKAKLQERKGLPAQVDDWKVEVGLDATGDAAVWVWVILGRSDVDRKARAALQAEVRELVGSMPWPAPVWTYVRFRTAAEANEE